MEEVKKNPTKVLKGYAYLCYALCVVAGISCIISAVCWLVITNDMHDKVPAFIYAVICAIASMFCFYLAKVGAAFIYAYANKCEDIQNINYILKEKSGINNNITDEREMESVDASLPEL